MIKIKKPAMLIFIALMTLALAPAVYAFCPVCVGATGAGVVIARSYGVDLTIIGIWIGAFIISLSLWINKVLKRKFEKSIPFQGLLLTILILILFIVFFNFTDLIGSQKIFGIDKLLFGIITGCLVTIFGSFLSNIIKNKRLRTIFPFQTIAIILFLLILVSLLFWLITRVKWI